MLMLMDDWVDCPLQLFFEELLLLPLHLEMSSGGLRSAFQCGLQLLIIFQKDVLLLELFLKLLAAELSVMPPVLFKV